MEAPIAGVLDVLKLPSDLPAGDYILGWRYDCEGTAQVWEHMPIPAGERAFKALAEIEGESSAISEKKHSQRRSRTKKVRQRSGPEKRHLDAGPLDAALARLRKLRKTREDADARAAGSGVYFDPPHSADRNA